MIIAVLLGVAAFLSSSSASWPNLERTREDYDDDLLFDQERPTDDTWFQNERKAEWYLESSPSYDDSDYEKFEISRGIPMMRAKNCMEGDPTGPFNVTLPHDAEDVYPQHYHNVACQRHITERYRKQKRAFRICNANIHGECITQHKEIQIFVKRNGCWSPGERITVQAGCKCF